MRAIRFVRLSVALALSLSLLPALGLAAESPRATENEPIGWASVDGGTTGGKGGATVSVADEEALRLAVAGYGPATVIVRGKITLSKKVRVGSNKTILGDAGAELTGFGLHLNKVENVIIRNLSIHDSADDAVNVEGGTRHVWIDHCDFANCHDGLVDIKHGSDLATVSWCRFHDHNKTCLLGHSDKASAAAEDRGRLRVTYHHNFFDGSLSRHPRARVGEPIHVFNNFYQNNQYGVASTANAGVLVEGNYFLRCKLPTLTSYGDSPEPGRLVERQNVTVESGPLQSAGEVPAVPYQYKLDDAQQLPELIPANAGVGKVSASESQGR
ncbi:MAG: right-handed parallel beta-helix repeat-containing protein [Planctomycetes bacterium]|nr:right-handed parallel beta-helix repeat-containing protein [Planctomycetota bacterium]